MIPKQYCHPGKLMKQSDSEETMAQINKEKLHFLFRIYDEDS